MITNKQKNILNLINQYIETEKISPTVRELCELAKVSSSSTIQGYLNRLQREGYISKKDKSPRSLRVLKSIQWNI